MVYLCWECKKEIKDLEALKVVRCPFCSSRILFKKREPIAREVLSV